MGPIIKRIGIGVGLATLVVLSVGMLLPATYTVSRSVVVNAEPAHIHTFVDDLAQWPNWTPWVKDDPTIEIEFGELTSGVGAHQAWDGDSGAGELTVTMSDPTTGVGYDMAFNEGKYLSKGTIEYKPGSDGTEVVWTMVGDNGRNPVSRYFGLMMDPMTGPMFEDGLNRLKLIAEKVTTPTEPTDPTDPTE
ncbi:MAG: hypothetical protein ACI9JE_001586 [Candidatus Krumholzibacteriia bacterium]|jgi:hypothetical protein